MVLRNRLAIAATRENSKDCASVDPEIDSADGRERNLVQDSPAFWSGLCNLKPIPEESLRESTYPRRATPQALHTPKVPQERVNRCVGKRLGSLADVRKENGIRRVQLRTTYDRE
jgi:hypothetical protein